MKIKKDIIFLVSLLINFSFTVYSQVNINSLGAVGDGKTLETSYIQKAIDKVSEDGGGTVVIPSGTYLTGTLILKDNVNLHLESGAVLLGSPNIIDYKEISQKFESRTNRLYAKYFLIFAEGAKNISITGNGIINGNGLTNFQEVRPQNLRPVLIRLVSCNNVTFRDVHLLESANWTLHLLACKNVNIDNIEITTKAKGNRDGLDIDCCKNVTVSNSRLSTTDDAIVMKASADVLCRDIAITNCILSSEGSAIKTGTESNGGFKNITVSNCIIKNIPMHSGIELMTVDGGMLQNVMIDNITMENVSTPFYIRIGIRLRPYKLGQYVKKIENVKDIHLNNISVENAKLPSSIMGLHDRKIQDVSITNYTVRYSYTQKSIPYNKVPFEEFSYPMAIQFKDLPAYGLYCRNVKGLFLQNINMYSLKNEKRSALTFDRINNLNLFSVRADVDNKNTSMVYLRNSENITTGYCESHGIDKSLFVMEKNCSGIHFSNNTLQKDQKEITYVKALPNGKIFDDFNTDYKYSVKDGKTIKGLYAQSLGLNPVKVEFELPDKGTPQVCLLISNESGRPEKVKIKYEGIVQEFLVDWKEWGWAPVTLNKVIKNPRKVFFEIYTDKNDSGLNLSKVYLRFLNLGYTD